MLDFLVNMIDAMALFALAMLGVDFVEQDTCEVSARNVPVVYVVEATELPETIVFCDTTDDTSDRQPEVFRI